MQSPIRSTLSRARFAIVAVAAAAPLLVGSGCASKPAPLPAVTAQPADASTTIVVPGEGPRTSLESIRAENVFARSVTDGRDGAAFGLQDVYFDFDREEIRANQREVLAANAKILSANQSLDVVIEGHCDELGTAAYNMGLGDRRANAVRDYLKALGIDDRRLLTVSYGKEKPADPGHDEAAHSRNRRGHFQVVLEPGRRPTEIDPGRRQAVSPSAPRPFAPPAGR